MNLFLMSVYLSSAVALVYILLLYLSHPSRRLPSVSMVLSFSVGMLAVIPAVLIERLVAVLVSPEILASSLAIAPVIEESVKLAVFAVTIWRLGYPVLIEPIDYAILFGVLGIGFGVYEDFWYIFNQSYPSWVSGDLGRFHEVFRWMTYARSFPGHLMFGALAGFLLGWSRSAIGGWRRALWICGAFAAAVLAHSAFNATATFAGLISLWTLMIGYLGLFLALRHRAAQSSPFERIRLLVAGESMRWDYAWTPVEILFAEGFGWPGKPARGYLQFFPLTLSLVILFPILVSGIYFIHRFLIWMLPGS